MSHCVTSRKVQPMLRLARRAEKETTYVEVGEVATLDHEVGDNAVEDGALVVQGLADRSHALLACTRHKRNPWLRHSHLTSCAVLGS